MMIHTLRGQLLIAAPRLVDPNFFRAVVLIIDHDENGAMGLVINQPTDERIEEVWGQVSESACNARGPIHTGGPCEGPLVVLHTMAEHSLAQPAPGVHYSAERTAVECVAAAESGPRKFILGYSGWAPGQLESEMDQASWVCTPATAQDVFDLDPDLWARLMRRISRDSARAFLNPKVVPDDPSVN